MYIIKQQQIERTNSTRKTILEMLLYQNLKNNIKLKHYEKVNLDLYLSLAGLPEGDLLGSLERDL